jgi:glycosyltransferase involved in cell wall biosynthesis
LICQDGPQRDLLWSRRLAALLDEHDVDVLHLRGLTMLTDGVLAAQFAGLVRTVMSFHGFETSPPRIGPIKRRVLRWAMGRCDARWAVSASAAGAIATELNMDDGDFDVVCNGVDTVHFDPVADREGVRRRLGLPIDHPIILSVGNLKPIKGHHLLLEAFARLPAPASGATLVLVGQDYMNGRLQRFVTTHLRGHDVRCVGRQADVAAWYQAADLFSLPSHYEGMSNALLEAMACGLPVIATNVGGNCDVIEHNRTGLLVAPGCADSLAGAMSRLLTAKIWRAQLGASARRHVQYNFDIRDTRADYEQRYEALAGQAENHE